jgi:hypothetical protein
MMSPASNDPSSVSRVKRVLRAGAIVFGLSAVTLIVFPAIFNRFLGLSESLELDWAMRMIGITLVALAGNMFSVARRGSDASVLFSGKVMMVAAAGLGVITLMIPAPLSWFTIVYAAIGFGFSGAYLLALSTK